MTDWTSLRYVVVDVEGNGQRPPDLVELAAVRIVDGIIGEPIDWLVRPDQPSTSFARRIHGISNEDVEGADIFADVEASVLEALDADVLIAHAAHVDVGVLQRKLGEWECPEVFDTLKLARRFYPGLPSYKLGALVSKFSLDFGLAPDLQPHRAPYDALVCARLFVALVDGRALEDIRSHQPGADDDEAPALF